MNRYIDIYQILLYIVFLDISKYLRPRYVCEVEESVEPGGGGRLGHLAPHQLVLLLDEELVVGGPGERLE